jgi:cytochrome c peroxidase
VGDIRPQEFRHRIDTPSLRGVNIQRLFGSQRALKTIEDFTEFEQRAAYFDGDPVIATKKGVNILERGSQVHFMAEFQALLDFPPAPKFKPQMVNGRMASMDGPIKTFPLRGIKDSPPYLHDGRLLTLEDTVEFFNLVQELNLSDQEKKDLVVFMRAL